MHLLRGALDSLRGQSFSDLETIVVDNGSSDGTRALLKEGYPDVRLVELDRNYGFAVAVNAGIRASHGEIIVLMNNDTEAAPDWLAALLRAFEEHPEVGCCASKMMMYHDRTRIDTAGDRWCFLPDQIGHGDEDGPQYQIRRYVLTACAGAAAYRREVFELIGGFDEKFETYLEDVDFGIRAQLAGFRCLYVPDAIIYHVGSATAGKRLSERKLYFVMRNSLFLFFQYHPLRTVARWGPSMLIFPFVRSRIENMPLRLALRTTWDFIRQLPAVWHRRRWVRQHRRISAAEFRTLLAPPLGKCEFGIPVAEQVRNGIGEGG